MESTRIFDHMRADHRRVLAEIEALERTIEGSMGLSHRDGRLSALVNLLERQFETHMRAEDDVLFPALASALPAVAGTIAQLGIEHDELRTMLKSLAETLRQLAGPNPEEQIAVQVQDLADLLRIHVRKEETLAFDLAERALSASDLAQLGTRITSAPGAPGATRKEGR